MHINIYLFHAKLIFESIKLKPVKAAPHPLTSHSASEVLQSLLLPLNKDSTSQKAIGRKPCNFYTKTTEILLCSVN